MKIWMIDRIGSCGYDEADGFIVRAKSPRAARFLCANQHGSEGPEVWVDPKQSTCKLLVPDGAPGVLLCSFNAG